MKIVIILLRRSEKLKITLCATLHWSSPGTRVTSEKMRAVLHCAVFANGDSGCYLELEASPPEVIVLGAFLCDLA